MSTKICRGTRVFCHKKNVGRSHHGRGRGNGEQSVLVASVGRKSTILWKIRYGVTMGIVTWLINKA